MKTKNQNRNLKIVNTKLEDEEAKKQREKKDEERRKEEDSWRLTHSEISSRVRELRLEFERARSRTEGMLFDAMEADCPNSVSSAHCPYPSDMVERFNPNVKGYEDRGRKP